MRCVERGAISAGYGRWGVFVEHPPAYRPRSAQAASSEAAAAAVLREHTATAATSGTATATPTAAITGWGRRTPEIGGGTKMGWRRGCGASAANQKRAESEKR